MISVKGLRIFSSICLFGLFLSAESNAQVKIGSNPTTIGTNANLEVESTNGSKISVSKDLGKLTIKDGSQGVGKVLTSDANGVATWVMPGATIESLPGTTGTPGAPGSGTPGAPAAGITIVVNDSGIWIYNPTTGLWTNINSQTGRVNIDAANGVMFDGQTIKLGGNLIEPTTIKSSSSNTLAISGLQEGKVTDDLLTMDPTTGVIRKISAVEFSMGTNMAKQKMIAIAGEKVFNTVWPIDSLDKIQVYRNGAEIDFSATEGTSQISLQLYADTNGGCLAGDEIKIYQWK